MKKKVWLIVIPAIILLAAVIVCGVLWFNRAGTDATVVTSSSDVFYMNELSTLTADPSVIYITEGEDAGYFYMYPTSDELGGSGYLAYKSKDLVTWSRVGVALQPEAIYDDETGHTTISFAFQNYWAPEVIYDSEAKLYYMFYTANRYDTTFQSANWFFGDIAISESPAGPFVPYNQYHGKEPVLIDEEKKILMYEPVFDFSKMPSDHPLYESNNNGYMKIIDLSPFIDPETGKKYVYFCHDLGQTVSSSASSIYVMELNDDYTANYEAVHMLTEANCYEVGAPRNTNLIEGKVNEAPFVVYNEDSQKYYLMFSANSYWEKTYSIRVAVGDSPVGPFKKLSKEEGGFLLYADSHWTWASGTGHCSVVNKNGQDYIAYHAHTDRVNGSSSRAFAFDELHWAENSNGLLVPVVNGPSATFMPLTTYQYENVAYKAELSATHLISKEDISLLNDKLIRTHEDSFVNEAMFDGKAATIKLEFTEAQKVSGIAVYNSIYYDYVYSEIQEIKLYLDDGSTVRYKDLAFDWDRYYTEDGHIVTGAPIALQFPEKLVTAIEISMPEMGAQYAVSEIAVIAKRDNQQQLEDLAPDGWKIKVPDDEMVHFDGIVNPEEYLGEKISFADTNGVTMTMYSKMAEEGVFFGFHSNDNRVFCNKEQAVFQNTSVEIQLAAAGTNKLNANVIQIRYSLDGTVEGWIGIPSSASYSFSLCPIDSVSKVHIYGELNSADCDGYDVEAFVPYSEMGLSEKPESLICAPSFNTRKEYEAAGRTTWTMMVGSSFHDPTSWYRIEAAGQTVMTDGFKENENHLIQTGGSNQFYYFSDELSDAYYVNVDIQIGDVLNGDEFPKFGVVSKSLDSLLGYYFDLAGGNVNSIGRIGARTTEFLGTAWDWDSNASNTFGIDRSMSLNYDRKVNVELIRYGNQLAMLVNGRFVLSDVDVTGLEDGSIPGLFFFNTQAKITVNAYQTDRNIVKNYIAPYMPEITLDADLTDWDLETTKLASEVDSANGNEMTVYAYRSDLGIYLAYQVQHGYQPRVYGWDGWFRNTNAEFYINDSQFAATAYGDSGYMVKAMKTASDTASGKYTTVVEVFVPVEVLEKDEATVGFAFKTCDQEYVKISEITDPIMKFRGDPWWFFEGRFPTDVSKHFVLK